MLKNKAPILFPDPVIDLDIISGANFLFFDDPITFTLPPEWFFNKKSFELLKTIKDKKPFWIDNFSKIYNYAIAQRLSFEQTLNIIKPIKSNLFKLVYLSHPATSESLNEVEDIISSIDLTKEDIFGKINLFTASGEIMRHIFLEKYLESNKDINLLYNYCDNLFRNNNFNDLLLKGYFLRLRLMKVIGSKRSIMVPHRQVEDLLMNFPVDKAEQNKEVYHENIIDVVAWEFFKQILSKKLYPLDKEKTEIILKLSENKKDELTAFKKKCYKLAYNFHNLNTSNEIYKDIRKYIKINIDDEIQNLLELDNRSLKQFFVSLFSDEKTWLGIAGFISSTLYGGDIIKAGSAIVALSSIGSKAFKEAAERKNKLKTSDYSLIYLLDKKYNM